MKTDDTRALLKTAAATMRHLRTENTELATKLAAYERKDLAEEVVDLMDARNLLDPSVPHKTKVAHVLASDKDLAATRRALLLTPANMSFAKTAEFNAPSVGNAKQVLDDFLLGR